MKRLFEKGRGRVDVSAPVLLVEASAVETSVEMDREDQPTLLLGDVVLSP